MVRGAVIQTWWAKSGQALARSKRLRRILRSKLTIPCIIFITFFISSLGIGGPAYMSDEVGYLSKAATIAGSTVHLPTSWFAGYSFMISPAFVISSNPFVTWHIILVINALMWAGTAALLQYILTRTHPKASGRAIFFVTLAAMLYPSWLSMSGYAFATSGFVLVFMASLAALLKSNFTNPKWLSAAALCAGYLGWIHPLGLLYLGLFTVVLVSKFFIDRKHHLALIPVAALALSLTYFVVVQPWLTHAMSGGVVSEGHYTAGMSETASALFTLDYWLQTGVLLVGLVFFTMVATFGLAAYGSIVAFKHLPRNKQGLRRFFDKPESLIMAMSVLIVVGVICFTAISWGASKPLRIDQWIYGRYTEMYLLPLIGFGLLASWKAKHTLKIAGFVVAAGLLLSVATNQQNTAYAYINKVNLQSFWPTHLPEVLRTNNYWVWGILGATGIAVCGLVAISRYRKFIPLMIAPVILFAGLGNHMYQYRIAKGYSSPSSLYGYIQEKYTAADCIGFAPEDDINERFNLYSYYLHGYDFKKMTLEQWQQQDCNGPYLTYDAALATKPNLRLTGLETKSGLYMITQTANDQATQPQQNESPIFVEDKLLGYAVIFK